MGGVRKGQCWFGVFNAVFLKGISLLGTSSREKREKGEETIGVVPTSSLHHVAAARNDNQYRFTVLSSVQRVTSAFF